MNQAWLVRTTLYGYKFNFKEDFVSKSYIGFGPGSLPNCRGANAETIRKYLLDNRICKDALSAGALAVSAYNFANKMEKGDIVLIVDKDDIFTAKIVGDYSFIRSGSGIANHVSHRRQIEVSSFYRRDQLSKRIKYALKSGRQIANLSKHYDEILDLYNGKTYSPVDEKSTLETRNVIIPLRPDFNINIEIPLDMTASEAERMSEIFKMLYFEHNNKTSESM